MRKLKLNRIEEHYIIWWATSISTTTKEGEELKLESYPSLGYVVYCSLVSMVIKNNSKTF